MISTTCLFEPLDPMYQVYETIAYQAVVQEHVDLLEAIVDYLDGKMTFGLFENVVYEGYDLLYEFDWDKIFQNAEDKLQRNTTPKAERDSLYSMLQKWKKEGKYKGDPDNPNYYYTGKMDQTKSSNTKSNSTPDYRETFNSARFRSDTKGAKRGSQKDVWRRRHEKKFAGSKSEADKYAENKMNKIHFQDLMKIYNKTRPGFIERALKAGLEKGSRFKLTKGISNKAIDALVRRYEKQTKSGGKKLAKTDTDSLNLFAKVKNAVNTGHSKRKMNTFSNLAKKVGTKQYKFRQTRRK